ncbi:MAG: tRNA-specific 2-thiouridylase MnmA [Candidatus Kaiserbacteria bacterium]|nr:tRNA-specific 2-thiouridylase MnmA [Candidatus Kaiserbacteria bacterium]
MAQTVFVGLSGGVDSAVSAALLKAEGYAVVGVFIKIWQPEFIECTWAKDRLDAMRVAASLGIAFKEVDLSADYQKEVVAEMIASYERGETPNPDVACNRKIKFGTFAKWARENGADIIATGHYARTRREFGTAELLRAIDTNKDQSYFLYQLDKNDLLKTIFPVGDMTKPEVRAKAKALDLPVADKHDSQGLCFIGDVSMRDFLKRFITVEEGAVLNTKGEAIGRHDGAALYTLGQRHGFVVEGLPAQKPQYVTALDTTKNTITVSENKLDAACTRVRVREITWVGKLPKLPVRVLAQSRYRETPVSVTVERTDDVYVTFDEPHIASPGQSIVFYDGDICLGGAIVDARCEDVSVHSMVETTLEKVQ